MTRLVPWLWGGFFMASVVLVGCKAAPAPNAGFADPKQLSHDPDVPFNKFWFKKGVDWKQYDKIYIADVNTSYMLKMTDWEKGERKDQIEKDVRNIAVYMRNSMMKAFRNDPNHRFQVLNTPTNDPHTLVFELALIEMVPSKVVLNVLGYAPFYVGTAITVVRTAGNDESCAAFESRTRDAATGQILILAADRETQQYAPIDFRGLTWYSDVQGIIDEWSAQWVKITERKSGQKIKGTDTFRLLPW